MPGRNCERGPKRLVNEIQSRAAVSRQFYKIRLGGAERGRRGGRKTLTSAASLLHASNPDPIGDPTRGSPSRRHESIIARSNCAGGAQRERVVRGSRRAALLKDPKGSPRRNAARILPPLPLQISPTCGTNDTSPQTRELGLLLPRRATIAANALALIIAVRGHTSSPLPLCRAIAGSQPLAPTLASAKYSAVPRISASVRPRVTSGSFGPKAKLRRCVVQGSSIRAAPKPRVELASRTKQSTVTRASGAIR